MNWLMYIGGGILWILCWQTMVEKKNDAPSWTALIITIMSALMVWIWICGRIP